MNESRESPVAASVAAILVAVVLGVALIRDASRTRGLSGHLSGDIGPYVMASLIVALSFVTGIPAALVAFRYIKRGGVFATLVHHVGLFFVTMAWIVLLGMKDLRQFLGEAPAMVPPGLAVWTWLIVAAFLRSRETNKRTNTGANWMR